MARKALTDRTLKALKAAPSGKHYDRWDATIPGLGVRVSDTGRKTFVLAARYPGSGNPTRRALGPYGAITLADARQKAQDWLKLIEVGKDPANEIERQRTLEVRRQENTFATVADDFIKDKLAGERKGAEVERDIRRVFIPAWGKRPITDITALDVRNLVKGYKDAGQAAIKHVTYSATPGAYSIGRSASTSMGLRHRPVTGSSRRTSLERESSAPAFFPTRS